MPTKSKKHTKPVVKPEAVIAPPAPKPAPIVEPAEVKPMPQVAVPHKSLWERLTA